MNVLRCDLAGLLVIEPKVHGDPRGFFLETWNLRRYREAGWGADFVQDNVSFSRRGTLRGVHFQNPNPQGKLLQVKQGEGFDVAVDLRRSSQPTWPILPMSSMRGCCMAISRDSRFRRWSLLLPSSCEEPVRGQVPKTQAVGVPFRHQRLLYRPFDADVRIVPTDGNLVPGRVELSALVMEQSGVTEHEKGVAEAGGNIELPLVFA